MSDKMLSPASGSKASVSSSNSPHFSRQGSSYSLASHEAVLNDGKQNEPLAKLDVLVLESGNDAVDNFVLLHPDTLLPFQWNAMYLDSEIQQHQHQQPERDPIDQDSDQTLTRVVCALPHTALDSQKEGHQIHPANLSFATMKQLQADQGSHGPRPPFFSSFSSWNLQTSDNDRATQEPTPAPISTNISVHSQGSGRSSTKTRTSTTATSAAMALLPSLLISNPKEHNKIESDPFESQGSGSNIGSDNKRDGSRASICESNSACQSQRVDDAGGGDADGNGGADADGVVECVVHAHLCTFDVEDACARGNASQVLHQSSPLLSMLYQQNSLYIQKSTAFHPNGPMFRNNKGRSAGGGEGGEVSSSEATVLSMDSPKSAQEAGSRGILRQVSRAKMPN